MVCRTREVDLGEGGLRTALATLKIAVGLVQVGRFRTNKITPLIKISWRFGGYFGRGRDDRR
jgi:hypothetical protein